MKKRKKKEKSEKEKEKETKKGKEIESECERKRNQIIILNKKDNECFNHSKIREEINSLFNFCKQQKLLF